MIKNLPKVVDHYDDSGAFLRESIEGNEVPEVIKTAADLSKNASKNDSDYALVVDTLGGREHRYPVVDAGNTLASAMYLSKVASALPAELQKTAAEKINAALKVFGFTPTESLEKIASIELGFSGPGMETDRSLESLFGVSQGDPTEVVKDAFDTASPRGKRRLMMQVKEAGLLEHLSDELTDYAREEVGSDFNTGLDLRKIASLSAQATMELDAIKEKVASASPEDLVEDLTDFDIRHEVTHLYGKSILDPYATVFGTSVEKTAGVSDGLEIDGVSYSSEDVNKFAENQSDTLTDVFGEDFVGQFKEDPVNVLGSLPITHKKAIARMIDG